MKITDNTFCVPFCIDRQLITEENAEYMFISLGKQIMSYIKRKKLIIPKGNFVAYVHVKFIPEAKMEEAKKMFKEEDKEEVSE